MKGTNIKKGRYLKFPLCTETKNIITVVVQGLFFVIQAKYCRLGFLSSNEPNWDFYKRVQFIPGGVN